MTTTTTTTTCRFYYHRSNHRLDQRSILLVAFLLVVLVFSFRQHRVHSAWDDTTTWNQRAWDQTNYYDAPLPSRIRSNDATASAGTKNHLAVFHNTTNTNIDIIDSIRTNNNSTSRAVKFFLLQIPEMTTWLVQNYTPQATTAYYSKALNEASAEVWLHRGFERMTREQGQTWDPTEADVFLIPGYCHLHSAMLCRREQQQQQQQEKKKNEPQPQGRRRTNNNKNGKENARKNTHRNQTTTTIRNPHHEFVHLYQQHILDPTKPHLLLIPSWNPEISRMVGIKQLVTTLHEMLGVDHLWTVGFERNKFWQGGIRPARIVPIPYVLRLTASATTSTTPLESPSNTVMEYQQQLQQQQQQRSAVSRNNNFVFYAGDARPHAKKWAGCYREKLIGSLLQEEEDEAGRTMTNATLNSNHNNNNHPSMSPSWLDVRIVTKTNRLNQTEYNHRMTTSEYCLILCGDTPSSRSLTSAMVAGCIPLFIGSRWRGLCEPPCHTGYGWQVTGTENLHLPFADRLDWNVFPEVRESQFLLSSTTTTTTGGVRSRSSSRHVLEDLFQTTSTSQKMHLRSMMEQVQQGWIYGWGDPVHSNEFGDAARFIWASFVHMLLQQQEHERQ
jgi:Exostosin family